MTKKIIISLVAIFILGAVGVYFTMLFEEKEKMVRVSGVVIDPLTRTPISGVDLAVGDTTIRTGESGNFVFTDVSTKKGIRLTHPEILRAITRLPEENTDILFDVFLYNTLITIIDREARNNLDFVYSKLAPEIRKKVSRELFQSEYGPLFSEEDIANQEIVVKRMKKTEDYYNKQLGLRFNDVIEFEITNSGESRWYKLIYLDDPLDGSSWNLIF